MLLLMLRATNSHKQDQYTVFHKAFPRELRHVIPDLHTERAQELDLLMADRAACFCSARSFD